MPALTALTAVPSAPQSCPVVLSENARQRIRFFGGGISIKSRRPGPPQGALRGHTSVFIGIIGIPTKAQAHGNHAFTKRARWVLRFCVDAFYIGVVMSLSHVTFLTHVEIMSYRLRLKMTTPI